MNNEDELPVTVVVTRKVKPGREKDYEQFLSDVSKVAHRYPGHLGVNIIHEEGSREYTLVFRFDTVKNLRRWEESGERAEWVAKGEAMAEAPAQVSRLTGMESWFALPGRTVQPPPKHKMAIMSFLAAFPIVQVMANFILPQLTFLPSIVRGIIMTVTMAILMTYVVMPQITRLFAGWLYPKTTR